MKHDSKTVNVECTNSPSLWPTGVLDPLFFVTTFPPSLQNSPKGFFASLLYLLSGRARGRPQDPGQHKYTAVHAIDASQLALEQFV